MRVTDFKYRAIMKPDCGEPAEWAFGYPSPNSNEFDAGLLTPESKGSLKHYEVDIYPETLSAFTGRLDSACKEIYEGDKFTTADGTFTVIYDLCDCAFVAVKDGDARCEYPLGRFLLRYHDSHVSGTMWDYLLN